MRNLPSVIIAATTALIFAASSLRADSGGRLIREQAAYDVLFYRLDLAIDPGTQSIGGSTLARALVSDTLSVFVLDLNDNFDVDSIRWRTSGDTLLTFAFTAGRLWINLPYLLSPGDTAEVVIHYRGVPRVSTYPPWDDGFVWETAPGGQPWAGVACETEGGDVWWPCKDHPSDEPDSVSLNFTVPDTLVCVSNGTLTDTADNPDGTRTFSWFVSNPIANYCVTFYLGPYVRIPVSFTSVTGDPVPSEYWFLPESEADAIAVIPLFLRDMEFFEEKFGPFPFRADKYGLVEAPYWGMEHQSAVAYGNSFNFNSYGFDYIHLHEVAHEWWGNLVTAEDWSDVWIHEGVACYTEALYAEDLNGPESYRSYMAGIRGFSNNQPVAPRDTLTASEGFNGPVYYKGAWVLHTLRFYLGDSTFFRLLRTWAYPDSLMESVTDGTQCRLATTDDFLAIAESVSGTPLDWFFEVYLRQLGIPRLATAVVGDTLYLKWYIENDIPFPVPVEVGLGADTVRVAMTGGAGKVAVPPGVTPIIDPDSWLLKSAGSVLSVSKSIFAFGGVNVDSTKLDSVVVRNLWATTLEITSAYADREDYIVTPASASIPAGAEQTFTIAFKPLTGGNKFGHVYLVHNAPGSPQSLTVNGSGIMPVSTYEFAASWNIVSLPLTRTDPRKSALFPAATTPAYAYVPGAGYESRDSLETGIGYWLKFDSGQSVTIAGFPVESETVNVATGWNLVGSVAEPLAALSVAADPPEMVTGGFFEYEGGYSPADSIHPARGYWIKVDRDGKLILSAPGMSLSAGPGVSGSGESGEGPSGTLIIVHPSDLPPPPPGGEAVSIPGAIPAGYVLEQNYPNPFNPSTEVRYQLPEAGRIRLAVYDLLGTEVAVLADEFRQAGYHSVVWDADGVPSGVYYYRLSAGSFTGVMKLLVMK